MIGISMITGDLQGTVELDAGDSVLGIVAARVSRYPTLDGGSVIANSGIAQGDRTFNIISVINSAQKSAIEHIYANSVSVNVACADGFFTGTISSVDTSAGKLKMTILIKDKEN